MYTFAKSKENNVKKFSFLLSFVLVFLIAFAPATEAATSSYTVKKGDTLYKIAKMHKVSVANIKSWNKLRSDLIKPNMKLKLVKPKASASKSKSKAKSVSRSNDDNVVKEFYVTSTSYTANCRGCSGITSTGINLKRNPDAKVIAVDPRVIKLGTKVYVEGYGYAIAGDTGSAIKGNKIDVFFDTRSEALNWGRRTVKIKILD
ncbi:LysM peptidoglycan-binding domain-containing protein [Paenisporosarcina cavernae]|uniref:LysM peptidoglycan-binding domain-containing protein n=1 Tax=Paenisporosarcina cavernae TaxID=2320858 RepID=A0A385YPP0_9BACL|nr:LysM peptidoglycan-binding domain-containing protein [Paenisporosarcina cavernae]